MADLAFLIPLFPLAAFAVIVLFTNPNKRLSSTLAIAGIGLSTLFAYSLFFQALSIGAEELWKHPEKLSRLYDWAPAGVARFQVGTYIDPLAAVTLVMVSTVCLMIFIYSQGYMKLGRPDVDPLYSRFFAYISLFACGMLGFVSAANLVQALVFWEIMGLCSYFLIGFWYARQYPDPKKITPRQAAIKAFLTTRIGDVLFLLGIVALWGLTGQLNFMELFKPEMVAHLAEMPVNLGPLGTLSAATLVALLLFGGAIGKSAQFPLHVWLPDAMEGPTPVSALIHAATMVAAGVFLVARTFPIFAAGFDFEHIAHSPALQVVALIGAFTALFAATIGVAQNDIKRVLAYSTVSQLGYMVMGLGIGAFVAAVFHLIAHAFFKALLFLGSGSVIHGVEHTIHQAEERAHESGHSPLTSSPVNEGAEKEFLSADAPDAHDANNMFLMGGLARRMPHTFWTFVVGALALTGIFPFAGFWSKDAILADAFWERHNELYIVGALAAFFTAFYMARQICLVFGGQPRHPALAEAARNGESLESPVTMVFPLIFLALASIPIGLLGTPFGNWFFHWLGFLPLTAEKFQEVPLSTELFVGGMSLAIALAGWALGWLVYGRKPLQAGQTDPLRRLGPLYTLLNRKYFVDEIYGATFIAGTVAFSRLMGLVDNRLVDGMVNLVGWLTARFADLSRLIDIYIVDGAVNLTGWVTGEISRGLRQIQTGQVQNYLVLVFFTLLILAGLVRFGF